MQSWFKLLRPRQWVKNVFLFAGLVFGDKLREPAAWGMALAGFACFCLLSSAVYIINDIRDRQEDRHHPTKRQRPIASGAIAPMPALLVALLLLAGGLTGALLIDLGRDPTRGGTAARFLMTEWSLAYVALNLLYSFFLKYLMLVDVITIAVGFVIRALAGAAAVEAGVSPWLVICTFMLCLFMGFGKRRCELAQLGEGVGSHRAVAREYSLPLLDHILAVTAGLSVVTYLLYTKSPRTIVHLGEDVSSALAYTTPLVLYGIFRFYALTAGGTVDGPTDVVTRDRPFQAGVGLWGLAVVLILYLR